MVQTLIHVVRDCEISGGRTLAAGSAAYLGAVSLARLVEAGDVEVIDDPPPARERARRVATRPKTVRVVVTGPFRWRGSDARPGDVIHMPASDYRKWRPLDVFEREFVRREFRGVRFLLAVAPCRKTEGVIRRGGCSGRR